ncbi:MAG: glycosyltransferase family 2 protein [Candidatus Helarchaeota archaeon]|nr:glycosyltransferase family 2 protein [Candidatus Helarchaeota archaeon]
MVNFCVLIPAYNEERNLKRLLDELKNYVDKERIIVVDDGSKDNTRVIAEKCGVCVIFHKSNLGKGEALRRGFKEAIKKNVSWVITMDSDMQHLPTDIPKFLEKAGEGNVDVILGSRMNNIKDMPFQRILSNKITSFLISHRIGQRVEDSQCGFRMISKKVIEKISLNKSHFSLESELLLKAGLKKFKIESVNIETIYNNSKSKINPLRDTLGFIFVFVSSFFWKN